jgi:DNA-binding CsgD family transcriptional regulator
MRIVFRIAIFCVLFLYAFSVFPQIKGTGLPFIVQHSRSDYNASTQNWAISQNSSGLMYFANNDGILEYNGTSWQSFPMPNGSVVRSLLVRGDTIFAGAFEQIGFLAPGNNGQLEWNSLNHLIPEEFSYFDEIWRIYEHRGKVIFQSFAFIFILDKNSITVIQPRGVFGFLHQTGNDFYIVDRGLGLMTLHGDSLVCISEDQFFITNEITALIEYPGRGILTGTSGKGFFIWNGNKIEPWKSEVNPHLIRNSLFSSRILNDGSFAFGTVSNGVYITDSEGNILQQINRVKGLQNNTVLSLFQDRRNNLWLGLDNGIDFLEISSPLSVLNHNFNIETAYTSIIHNDILYVGTNQGLYAANVERAGTPHMKVNDFRLISGTEGQVWSLQVIDNTLFCGHNFGCFQVEGFAASQISNIRGFWSFIKLPGMGDRILAGTYSGFVKLRKSSSGRYSATEIPGFRESSREFFIDRNRILWMSHGYKGLYRLKFNENFNRIQEVVHFYNEAGLPETLPYNIQQISGEMYVTTAQGILKYNEAENSFMPDEWLNSLFEGKGFLERIRQDPAGNLWYYTNSYLGVMRLLEDGTYRDIRAPFTRINNNLLPAFQNLFIADMFNIFIGSQSGMIHYNPSIISDYNPEDVYISDVHFYNNRKNRNFRFSHYQIMAGGNETIPFAVNSVNFRFTSTVYENPGALRFSYRLKGFDTEWSDWESFNFKEYTNLREGNYTFEVKALNAFGIESRITSFDFRIAPPFYRSRMAIFIYVLMFLLIIAGNIHFIQRRLKRIKAFEKSKHELKMARREQIFKEHTELSEREIMQLRNEKLISEMNHKNKELANATLHLIQKNKTLTSLKNDLGKLMKSIPGDKPEKQNVTNLLKRVNRDLRNEKGWELFNNYFDEVHQDFISRLKEKHTDLSPKELRLCAYLRMNLSTKEIAPLMNISIRGVEISRYRLRKKLLLEHDVNLSDYLISY